MLATHLLDAGNSWQFSHGADLLQYDGRITSTSDVGTVFGWLLIPQKGHYLPSGVPAASLRIDSSGAEGQVHATVSIGGRQEPVSLALGRAPAPPPPCAATEVRVCGECKTVPLTCPHDQRLDFIVATGDDGSCSCDEYCATDWDNAAKTARPHWSGATSAFGKNSSAFRCQGTGPLLCLCVQARHFCPKIEHLCKSGCDKLGEPVAQEFCVPTNQGL